MAWRRTQRIEEFIESSILRVLIIDARINMTIRTYSMFTASLFTAIAVLHLLRLGLSWDAVIGGVSLPTWASLIAFAFASYLAYEGFRLAKEKKQ